MGQSRYNRLAGRDARGLHAELERCDEDVALTDAVYQGLARLPGDAEPLHFPGPGRDEAAQFSGQFNASRRAKSDGIGGFGHLVYAKALGHFVQIDIA